MTFKPWIPPAGEVVDPPVHTETIVDVLFSDRSEQTGAACLFNWSGEGDGPKIIAYSVVEEYVEKREPREWWINLAELTTRLVYLHDSYHAADEGRRNASGAVVGDKAIVHVREVLPEAPLDLTKITTPFGLLDEATQAALKAHGGPWEYWDGAKWKASASSTLMDVDLALAYRVAPSAAPAKPAPREVVAWAVVDDKGSPTIFYGEGNAMKWQREEGGTVRPLGFLP